MPEPTPLYAATAASASANSWTCVNGWSVPRVYTDIESEYHAARHEGVIADLGSVMRYVIKGEQADAFLTRFSTAPAATLTPGEGARGLILDDAGVVIDFADISRLTEDTFLLTTPLAHARWLQVSARGFEIEVDDVSTVVAAVGIFGPNTHDVLQRAGLNLPGDGAAVSSLVRGVETAARPIRFGVLAGVELIFPKDEALTLWERLTKRAGLCPIGLDAMEALRLEAGAPRPNLDFAAGLDASWAPGALGLSHLAPLDAGWFNGRRALRDRPWGGQRLVTLAADADHVSPGASVISGGKKVGQVTSAAWSPAQRRVLVFAEVMPVKGGNTYEIHNSTSFDAAVLAHFFETPEAQLRLAYEKELSTATENGRFSV